MFDVRELKFLVGREKYDAADIEHFNANHMAFDDTEYLFCPELDLKIPLSWFDAIRFDDGALDFFRYLARYLEWEEAKKEVELDEMLYQKGITRESFDAMNMKERYVVWWDDLIHTKTKITEGSRSRRKK